MAHETLIELKAVSFSYPDHPPIFQSISAVFETGRFYVIQGLSGAGKSTLLRLLNRLEEPASGDILFHRRPLADYRPPELRRRILYIQQIPTVIDGSVRDNLLLPFGFKHNQDLTRPDEQKLLSLLGTFRLRDVRLEQNALQLSVGQLQRLCFIRGILLSPEVVMLDEPTSALDKESVDIVESKSEELCRETGQTVIMVSHKTFRPRAVRPIVLDLKEGNIAEA